MQATPFYNSLIKIDVFLDYIPVISTATNLISIFLKYAFIPFLKEEKLLANHYLIHLKQKSTLRCLYLLIPFLGNFICLSILVWNKCKKEQKPFDSFKRVIEGKAETSKEYEAAFKFLQKALELEQPDELSELARFLLSEREPKTILGKKIELHDAREYLCIAANLGEPHAKSAYGRYYLKGNDNLYIYPDKENGFGLSMESAEKNIPSAFYNLYLAFNEGLGTEIDHKKALEYLLKSVSYKYPEGINQLGIHYKEGSIPLGISKDEKKAFKLFHEAANENYPPAFFNLFCCYKEGVGTQVNLKIALTNLYKGAHLKNAQAMSVLGDYYLKGSTLFDITKDEKKGFEFTLKAYEYADKKDPVASYNLYLCYRDGLGTLINAREAVGYLYKAEELDYPPAFSRYGYYSLKGSLTLSIAKNFANALESFTRASEKDDPFGTYNLYLCYRDGLGTEADPIKASGYLQKALTLKSPEALVESHACQLFESYQEKAAKNDPETIYKLFLCSLDGIGTKTDCIKAASYLHQAVDLKYPPAIGKLGFYYTDGFSPLNIEHNESRALELLKEAAEKEDPFSTFTLAVCYLKAIGTERNFELGSHYLFKAFKLNDPAAIGAIGGRHLVGIDVVKDISKGFELLKKAALLMNAQAIYHLSNCYKNGVGTAIDLNLALKYFNMAVDLEHYEALGDWGFYNLYGYPPFNITQNTREGLRWMEFAAEAEHPESLYNLFLLYTERKITPPDPNKAAQYLQRAAKAGHKEAINRLNVQQQAIPVIPQQA